MKVKVKKLHGDAVIPKHAKKGDAGLDLTAISKEYDEYANAVYKTGLAIEIPENYVGLIFPRSSNSKTDQYLTNSVGVIDSGYRGELMVKYKNVGINSLETLEDLFTGKVEFKHEHKIGDRVAQLIIIPYPQIEFEEVEELSETERGTGGYGSSGN